VGHLLISSKSNFTTFKTALDLVCIPFAASPVALSVIAHFLEHDDQSDQSPTLQVIAAVTSVAPPPGAAASFLFSVVAAVFWALPAFEATSALPV
jgi:hypothetical protein